MVDDKTWRLLSISQPLHPIPVPLYDAFLPKFDTRDKGASILMDAQTHWEKIYTEKAHRRSQLVPSAP